MLCTCSHGWMKRDHDNMNQTTPIPQFLSMQVTLMHGLITITNLENVALHICQQCAIFAPDEKAHAKTIQSLMKSMRQGKKGPGKHGQYLVNFFLHLLGEFFPQSSPKRTAANNSLVIPTYYWALALCHFWWCLQVMVLLSVLSHLSHFLSPFLQFLVS